MKRFIPLFIVLIVGALGALGYLTIEHYGIKALISVVSVYGVAAIIFAESGLLFGFFLPGDSLLFTAGFLVHQGFIDFNIHMLVLLLFIAATLGDNVGYTFGRRVGRRLFRKKESILFHKENLRHAEEFYLKHGGKTVVFARFIPVVRTFAPIIAGVSHMPYRLFMVYNLIGAFLWAVGLTYLGYFAGNVIEKFNINIEHAIIAIILLSISPPLIHFMKSAKNRRALLNWVKKLIKDFLNKK